MMNTLTNQVAAPRKFYSFMCGLLSVLALLGCAATKTYNLQEMEGYVVDSQTKKPLEDVMVVESWEALEGRWHNSSAGFLPLREAATDKAGHYAFRARGVTHVDEGHLRIADPFLLFFKPGYRVKGVSNRFHPDRRFDFNRRSDWHQKTIELEALDGGLGDYANELEQFSDTLDDFTGRGGWCIWIGIPRTLSVIRREDIKLENQGVDPKVAISAPWIMEELGKCPHYGEFLRVFENGAH